MTANDDPRDVFIASVVPGRTFADLGGLWGTVNERVSVAAAAGAATVTMIDLSPLSSPLWDAFHERLEQLGIHGCDHISWNLDSPVRTNLREAFDVVHCSGVIYHAPNPLLSLSQLARLTREYLILTSMIVPEVMRDPTGAVALGPGEVLALPHLPDEQREIVRGHFAESGIGEAAGIDIAVERWRLDDYAPWWWLFTVSALAQLIRAAGFEIVDSKPVWEGRAHAYLARKTGAIMTPFQKAGERLLDEVARLERQLDYVHGSRSWRGTSPVRRVFSWARSARQRAP